MLSLDCQHSKSCIQNIPQYDVIWLSETFFDSSVLLDNHLWNYTPEIKRLCCCRVSIPKSILEFEEVLSNFDTLLNYIKQFRPSFTIILGNFSARSKSWWPEDVTSYEGIHIESLSTMHGLQQLITDPTHLLPNLITSCTGLIFTNQTNLVVNSDIHSSVHAKCHH